MSNESQGAGCGSLVLVFLVASMTNWTGCGGGQILARSFGGTATIKLKPGYRYLHSSWRGDHVWYAARPRRAGETPETVELRESDPLGFPEGVVYFVEQ